MLTREVGERLGGLRQRVRRLHRDAQRVVGQQRAEALEVLAGRCGHHVGAAGTLAGGAGRGGDARAVLERGVVRARRVGDEVEQRVDAVGEALAVRGDDVAPARDDLADAEAAEELLVLGQRRRDDRGAGLGGELDREAADAASGAASRSQLVSPVPAVMRSR